MMLLLLAALAAHPQPGAIKTFKDWAVGCDNGRSCHATALMPEGGDWDRALMISVERAAGPDARPTITLLRGDEAAPVRLIADGKPIAARLIASETDFTIAAADVGAVIAGLKSAHAIDAQDDKGQTIGRVSLAGASAALLYIDDVQGRLGTVTALVRPGPRPANAVPPAPSIPQVRSAAVESAAAFTLDGARTDALRRQSDCVPEEKDWPGYGAEQEMLDANHALLLLGCGAGAYNYSSIPFIVSRRSGALVVETAKFDLVPNPGEDGSGPILVNASWDLKEGLLTSFSKGRGLGDCGVGRDFAWDGERFRLVQEIRMDECRGSVDYITTWRARVVRP